MQENFYFFIGNLGFISHFYIFLELELKWNILGNNKKKKVFDFIIVK